MASRSATNGFHTAASAAALPATLPPGASRAAPDRRSDEDGDEDELLHEVAREHVGGQRDDEVAGHGPRRSRARGRGAAR